MEEADEFSNERRMGISEFLGRGAGFKGVLRHRFEDFRVNEIDVDGNVARLTKTLLEDESLLKDAAGGAAEKATTIDMAAIRNELGGIIKEEGFYERVLGLKNNERDGEEIVTPSIRDKEDRTKVHRVIREGFGGQLQSETEAENCIRIYRKHSRGENKRKRDDRNVKQKEEEKQYLEFVLEKENLDTMDAVQLIARRLHIPAKDITYAGTKDKRGVTAQKIVIKRVTAKRVMGINKLPEAPLKIRVSNVKKAEGPLRLGDLKGNRFELIIRDIKLDGLGLDGVGGIEESKRLKDMVLSFGAEGFINYFGLQRFGRGSVSSADIGVALLRGEWEKAIKLILDPRADEGDERAILARKYYKESGNAVEAQGMFPFRYTAERQVLWHFSRNDQRDLLGAIMGISRELRLMYLHSVQSLVWNRMASERIRLYGTEVMIGDLVVADAPEPDALCEPDVADEAGVLCESDVLCGIDNGEELDAVRGSKLGKAGGIDASDTILADEQQENHDSQKKPNAIIVTEENKNRYTMQDIVLPIPGYESIYPVNSIGRRYREELESLGLTVESFYPQAQKSLWDLPGAYRKVFVVPKGVESQIGYYDGVDADLFPSVPDEGKGNYLGMRIAFDLPSSAYATMAIRQLMKTSSDPLHHKARTMAMRQK